MAEGRLGRIQDALGFALATLIAIAVVCGVAFAIWFNVTNDSRAQADCQRNGGTVVAVSDDRRGWECGSG